MLKRCDFFPMKEHLFVFTFLNGINTFMSKFNGLF